MKKTAYITFRTDEITKEALENIAKREDRTLSYILNKILTEHLAERREVSGNIESNLGNP